MSDPTRPPTDLGCGCEKRRRRWRMLQRLILIAGVSLAVYMPWKAFTQYESLRDIYGPWFLQGAVVASAGILFGLFAAGALRTPLILRGGVVAAAGFWMYTGILCTPSLAKRFMADPLAGGFAWFHMTAQHVFLSLGVMLFAMAPAFVARRLGVFGDEHDVTAAETANA